MGIAFPSFLVPSRPAGSLRPGHEVGVSIQLGVPVCLNVLLGPDRVWIIDWAWPTRGAAFIDAACFLIRAMAAGHSASQAEALVTECPGWQAALSAAIDVFALASARLYDEIVRNDPQPFKQRLAAVTHDWACHRVGVSVSPTGRRLGSGGSC